MRLGTVDRRLFSPPSATLFGLLGALTTRGYSHQEARPIGGGERGAAGPSLAAVPSQSALPVAVGGWRKDETASHLVVTVARR